MLRGDVDEWWVVDDSLGCSTWSVHNAGANRAKNYLYSSGTSRLARSTLRTAPLPRITHPPKRSSIAFARIRIISPQWLIIRPSRTPRWGDSTIPPASTTINTNRFTVSTPPRNPGVAHHQLKPLELVVSHYYQHQLPHISASIACCSTLRHPQATLTQKVFLGECGCTTKHSEYCGPKSAHGQLWESAGGRAVAIWPAHRRCKGCCVCEHLWCESCHGWPLADHDLAIAHEDSRQGCDHVRSNGRHDAARTTYAATYQWVRQTPTGAVRSARSVQLRPTTPTEP